MARFDLTGAECRSSLGSCRESRARRTAAHGRTIARLSNGVFFVLRTGTPWRDLPRRYGPHDDAQSIQSLGQGGRLGPDIRGLGGKITPAYGSERIGIWQVAGV